MSNSDVKKKMKFTDENVDAYQKQFMLELDRAMGNLPCEPTVQDICQIAI